MAEEKKKVRLGQDLLEIAVNEGVVYVAQWIVDQLPDRIIGNAALMNTSMPAIAFLVARLLPDSGFGREADRFMKELLSEMRQAAERKRSGGSQPEKKQQGPLPKSVGGFGNVVAVLARLDGGLEVLERIASYGPNGAYILEHLGGIKPRFLEKELTGLTPEAVDSLAKVVIPPSPPPEEKPKKKRRRNKTSSAGRIFGEWADSLDEQSKKLESDLEVGGFKKVKNFFLNLIKGGK